MRRPPRTAARGCELLHSNPAAGAVARGAVIAGIDRHLRGAAPARDSDTSASTAVHLEGLRRRVLAKASRLLSGKTPRTS